MKNSAHKTSLTALIPCLFALLTCSLTASAVEPVPAQASPAISSSADAIAPATVKDLEALTARIESNEEREHLLGEIRALIALQHPKTQPEPKRPFSERLTETVLTTVEETSKAFSSIDRYLPNWEVLSDWFQKQIRHPENLGRLSNHALPIALILVLAWISEFVVERLLDRFRKRIENRAAGNQTTPFGPALARAGLRLCALAVFAIVAVSASFFLQPGAPLSSIVVQIFVAYITGRAFVILARMVLAPSVPALRLVPLRTESALELFSRIRRLVIVGLIGYLLAGTGLLFGLPPQGFSFLMDLLGTVLLVMIISGILRNRNEITLWIRGPQETTQSHRSFGLRFRSGLAAVWHIPTILYLIGVFVVWWQNIEGGFVYLVRGTFLSVLILFAARFAIQGIRIKIAPKITVNDSLQDKFPLLAQRVKRYAPVLFLIVRIAIMLFTAVVVLEAWKVEAHRWLAEPFVRQSLAFLFTLCIILAISAAIWETVNIATEHYLAKSEKPEHTPGHRARVRTLLPLIRKALMIVLTVMVVMIVLSEFGVNIGPLLTGAGIIGLAVGFGAQKLVQDIITGVFILLEDAVAIGDVVKVAGIGGLVEDLSIRSIRLRDLSGNVHTIPFSSVDTVTNMTKQYSYYLIDIGVAYREDTDQVSTVCREIVDGMRSDPAFGSDILEPLEVLGVDQFADSAVIIKARIKTRPIKQWTVGREFNRRMKKRFDALGIEIPFPHQTLYFGAGKDGSAPPVHLFMAQK